MPGMYDDENDPKPKPVLPLLLMLAVVLFLIWKTVL